MTLIDLEDDSIDADLLNSMAVTMDDFQVQKHAHILSLAFLHPIVCMCVSRTSLTNVQLIICDPTMKAGHEYFLLNE